MPSPVYRLAVDDVIYSLRDVAQRRPASIFDCHFLAMFRELHRDFGTCVTLNIFYETDEGDFTLKDFPADYRSEWEANASWLRLAFHARKEHPGRPYAGAPIATFVEDYEAVKTEVLRFAGPEAWAPPCIIHFAMIPDGALPTMAEWGVRYLGGLFRRQDKVWSGHYGVADNLAMKAAGNDLITDPASGITLSCIDLVINNCPVDQVASELAKREDTPARPGKIDLLTHEQYSWPFYSRYLPDHRERITAAIRWCADRGYSPTTWLAP